MSPPPGKLWKEFVKQVSKNPFRITTYIRYRPYNYKCAVEMMDDALSTDIIDEKKYMRAKEIALIEAVENNDLKVVHILVKSGMDTINLYNEDDTHILYTALYHQYLPIATFLHNHGASLADMPRVCELLFTHNNMGGVNWLLTHRLIHPNDLMVMAVYLVRPKFAWRAVKAGASVFSVSPALLCKAYIMSKATNNIGMLRFLHLTLKSKLSAACTIWRHWTQYRNRKRHMAAIVIQRWAKDIVYMPGGGMYMRAHQHFYALAAK